MPRKPNEKLPANPHELEGLSKAAILLSAEALLNEIR